MPTTSPLRPRTVKARSRPCASASRTARSIPGTWATSTPTARRHPRATSPRRRPSRRSSAIRRESSVFGSTKSMTGHLLGGAGALEFAASLLSATCGVIPPNDQSVHSRSQVRSRLGSQPQGRAQGGCGSLEFLRLWRAQRDPRPCAPGRLTTPTPPEEFSTDTQNSSLLVNAVATRPCPSVPDVVNIS